MRNNADKIFGEQMYFVHLENVTSKYFDVLEVTDFYCQKRQHSTVLIFQNITRIFYGAFVS